MRRPALLFPGVRSFLICLTCCMDVFVSVAGGLVRQPASLLPGVRAFSHLCGLRPSRLNRDSAPVEAPACGLTAWSRVVGHKKTHTVFDLSHNELSTAITSF